ncbi:MAG TPA: hypothetical protein VFA45_04590, partial [Actinomycetes bacterium]|nr:hypothetical protein [Actinomycetes bacterium]
MRLCRGVSAVLLLAALAFIVPLALPAAGQPASTTSSTSAAGTGATGVGNAVTATTAFQQGAASNPLDTGAAATSTAPGSGGEVGAPPGRGAVLILVRRLSWRQAAAAVRGRSETIAAGLVSTLPADASLAGRVLSLAAG